MHAPRTLLPYLVLISFAFLFQDCSKEKKEKLPSADFIADKSEYIEGETAVFTQKSSDAETYRWTLPDGTTQKGETASYPLPVHGADGVIQVKLEVFSKSGNKSDVAVKNFPVKAATGDLMIWTYHPFFPVGFAFNTTTITVDNSKTFTGQLLNQADPPCGQQPGCAFFRLNVGTHIIVTAPTPSSYTVQVTKDACIKLEL